MTESAGLNRHIVGDARALRKGEATPISASGLALLYGIQADIGDRREQGNSSMATEANRLWETR